MANVCLKFVPLHNVEKLHNTNMYARTIVSDKDLRDGRTSFLISNGLRIGLARWCGVHRCGMCSTSDDILFYMYADHSWDYVQLISVSMLYLVS